jgi:hypothetical protein
VNPEARKIIGVLLLALLAVPTGLCSMAFTPAAMDSFSARDAFSRDIGRLALICSGIGYAICGLSIWGAIRLARPQKPKMLPKDPPP